VLLLGLLHRADGNPHLEPVAGANDHPRLRRGWSWLSFLFGINMSYLSDITLPLIQTLEHFTGLPAHQLAGHAANLDFWRSEVEHRRRIIGTYQARFNRMSEAQQAYGSIHGFGTKSGHGFEGPVPETITSLPPLRKSTTDSERKALLKQLDQAFNVFCERLKRESLIESDDAEPAAAADGHPRLRAGGRS